MLHPTVKAKMVPKFKHDCTGCKFIGTGSYYNKTVDWYVCEGVI